VIVVTASVDAPTTFNVPPSEAAAPTLRDPPVTTNPPVIVVTAIVDAPTTFNVSPTYSFFSMPTPPLTRSAPVVELEDWSEQCINTFPPRLVLPFTANPPFDTFRAPVVNEEDSSELFIISPPELRVKKLVYIELTVTTVVEEPFISPPIPNPPLTWRAPVAVLEDGIELYITTFPPIFVLPFTANPPFDIFSAPVNNENDSSVSFIVIGLFAVKKLVVIELTVTTVVEEPFISPPIPNPPLTWRAPVAALEDGIELYIITLPPACIDPASPSPPNSRTYAPIFGPVLTVDVDNLKSDARSAPLTIAVAEYNALFDIIFPFTPIPPFT
jgi:hypothetical protein